MSAQDWVTVATESSSPRAEIIKNALEAEGMPCTLEGENQAAEAGLAALPIKIQVPTGWAERAREFIQAHERARPEA